MCPVGPDISTDRKRRGLAGARGIIDRCGPARLLRAAVVTLRHGLLRKPHPLAPAPRRKPVGRVRGRRIEFGSPAGSAPMLMKRSQRPFYTVRDVLQHGERTS